MLHCVFLSFNFHIELASSVKFLGLTNLVLLRNEVLCSYKRLLKFLLVDSIYCFTSLESDVTVTMKMTILSFFVEYFMVWAKINEFDKFYTDFGFGEWGVLVDAFSSFILFAINTLVY